ncbi:long-chain-fatty-acid--CoA ligase [Cumulibacter soli]|uniref:long-chain-fatty-acid--CoA ligase n=1 Tax=Cumulibacter soli TaxID=2546344 RepID=UPI001068BB95|nr:long-chain-fatty-acid--CoA ligase [Cumulibacter soli]
MYLTMALHRNLQQQPDVVATICGDRVRTHRESIERVSRIAAGIRAAGSQPGERIAILALNSDYYHEVLLACSWADAVFVPVNVRWSALEIVYSLIEAEVSQLFVDATFAGLVEEIRTKHPQISYVVHLDPGPAPEGTTAIEDLVAAHDPIPDAHRSGESLAGIFYTGGTTGSPKGVMLSHRNLMTSAVGAAATGFVPMHGRLLHAAPMFHLADLAAWNAINAVGGSHVMIPSFEPVATMQAIAEHKVTASLLVPTMIQMLVDHPAIHDHDLGSITHVLYGASAIPEAVMNRTRAVFPDAQFSQAYGMTEVSPVGTILLPHEHDDATAARSVGRAAPHSLIKIVGPDDEELPVGTPGQICIAGDHVMMGYLNKPQETEEALRGGWMHTGDGGYVDANGYVFLTDRLKDMIITGGENVYSIEVENIIATHPSVASCAVVGVPDEKWGETVHAVVVLADGTELTIEELRSHCAARLAGYKCPTGLSVVAEMPLSGAGKILKRTLRDRLASSA